jgi:hypothetical protein
MSMDAIVSESSSAAYRSEFGPFSGHDREVSVQRAGCKDQRLKAAEICFDEISRLFQNRNIPRHFNSRRLLDRHISMRSSIKLPVMIIRSKYFSAISSMPSQSVLSNRGRAGAAHSHRKIETWILRKRTGTIAINLDALDSHSRHELFSEEIEALVQIDCERDYLARQFLFSSVTHLSNIPVRAR